MKNDDKSKILVLYERLKDDFNCVECSTSILTDDCQGCPILFNGYKIPVQLELNFML